MIISAEDTLSDQRQRNNGLDCEVNQNTLRLKPEISIYEERENPNQRSFAADAKRIAEQEEMPQEVRNDQSELADKAPESNSRDHTAREDQ